MILECEPHLVCPVSHTLASSSRTWTPWTVTGTWLASPRRSGCWFYQNSIDNKASPPQTTAYATSYSLRPSIPSFCINDPRAGSCWGSRHQVYERGQLD